MFRPQIQKTRVLFSLAVFCILMVYIALKSIVIEKTIGFPEKMEAAMRPSATFNAVLDAVS